MAKMGGTSIIDKVTKRDGAQHGNNGWNWCYRHRDKNGWSSLWQKWVELTVAKIGGALHDKNGWNSLWQKWVELVL